jgi:hypothetical protein
MSDNEITDTKTDDKQTEEAKDADSVAQEPAESGDHGNANINDAGNVADAEAEDTEAVGESIGPVADERIDHDAEAPSPTEDRVAGDDGSGQDPRDWEVDTDPTDPDGEEIAPASDWETRDPDALDELSPNGADPHDFSVRDTPEFFDPRTTGIDSKLPEQSEGPGHAWEEYGVDTNPILTYTSETDENGNLRQTSSDGTTTWLVDGEPGGIRTDPETGEVIEMVDFEVFDWIADHPRVREDDAEILKEIAADEAAPKTPLREAVDAREAQKQAEADDAAQEAGTGESGVGDPGPDGGVVEVDVGELPPLSGDAGSGDIDPVDDVVWNGDEGDQQFGQGDLEQPAGPDDDGELGEAGGHTPAPDPIDYGPDHVDPSTTGQYDNTGNPDFGTGTIDIDFDDEPGWMDQQTYEMEDPADGLNVELDLLD